MANIKLTANERQFVNAMDNAAGAVGRFSAELNIKMARALRETDALSKNFQKGFGQLGDKISSVGRTLTTSLTLPLSIAGGMAAKVYGDIDQLKRGLDAYGISLNEIKKTAKLPGLGLEEAAKSTITFASVKFAADVSTKAVREFGNALIYSGRGKEELAGIATAFAQMKGKGNVMAQEINQIAERLPMIRDLMMQAFGTSDTEVLQKQGISADVFLAKIVGQMEKLPRVAGGFKVGMENIIDSLKLGAYESVNIADKLFGLTGMMNSVSEYIDKAVESFKQLSPEVQSAIFVIGGLALAAGPVITAIGFIVGSVIPTFLAGLATISAPMLGVAAVVAIAVANIIKYWDKIKSVLVDSGIWDGVAAIFKSGLGFLNSIVGIFYSLFTADWEGFWKNLKTIVARLWNTLVEIIAVPFKALFEFQRMAANAFGLTSLSKGATTVLGWIDSVAENVKAKIPESTNYLKKFSDAVSNIKPAANTGKSGGKNDDGKKDKFAYMDAEWMSILNRKVANSLGDLKQLSYSDYFKNELAELQKLIGNPTDFQITWADNLLAASKRLKDGMPKIMSVIGVSTESAFKKDVLERMKKAFSDFGNLDTSAIISLPALVAQQINFSAAGLKVEQEIKKNIGNKVKLALMELQESMGQTIAEFKLNAAVDLASGIGEAIGTAISGGGFDLSKVFSGILSNLGSMMIQLGKQLLVYGKLFEAAKVLFKANPIAGGIAMIAAGGIIKGVASSAFSKAPRFAQGGMVLGPTMAVMGDNASGREMALPWEKTSVFAQAIAANLGGGGMGVGRTDVRLRGEDLYLAIELYKRNNGIR